jgi:hypothetical protein
MLSCCHWRTWCFHNSPVLVRDNGSMSTTRLMPELDTDRDDCAGGGWVFSVKEKFKQLVSKLETKGLRSPCFHDYHFSKGGPANAKRKKSLTQWDMCHIPLLTGKWGNRKLLSKSSSPRNPFCCYPREWCLRVEEVFGQAQQLVYPKAAERIPSLRHNFSMWITLT